MAEANIEIAATARGAPVTHAQQIAAAKAIGLDDVLQIQAGKFNAPELRALVEFYAASSDLVYRTARKALEAPNEANLFASTKAQSIFQALLEKLSGASAEAGRTLNILGAATKIAGKERLKAMRDLLDGMGGKDAALARAQKIRELELTGPSARDLNEPMKRIRGAKTLDAIAEGWTLGLVSGFRTQARNLLSNTLYMFEAIGERGLAARMPGSEVEKGEAMMMAFGITQSLREAFVNAGHAFKTGTAGFGLGKIDLPHRKAISSDNFPRLGAFADLLGGFFRVFGRGLTAGDEIFKTLNYNGEKWALALRQAKKEGLDGDAFFDRVAELGHSPTESMRIASRDAANYLTFTTRLGEQGQRYMDFVHRWPLMRFITPFMRTPANLFKAGLARTPFALAMPETFWKEINAGGARRDMALARIATGSALMLLWSDLTMRGQISGEGPLDRIERANLRRTGWAPYSVKMADHWAVPESIRGQWVNYRAIEPIGMVLGMAADMTEKMMQYQEMLDDDDPDGQMKLDKLAWASLRSLTNSVTSQTFMRGVSDFFRMMNDPFFTERYWARLPATLAVPRIVPSIGDISRSWGEEGKELKEVSGLIDEMVNSVPWLRDAELTPLRDLWGNKVVLSGAWGPEWLSPIYKSADKGGPMDRLLVKQKIKVRRPQRKQGFQHRDYPGITITMNMREFPEVFDEFMQLQGHKLKHPVYGAGAEAFLNAVADGSHGFSGYFDALPDGDEDGIDDKGAFIKARLAEYRKLSRIEIMRGVEYEDNAKIVEFRDEIRKRARRKFGQLTGQGE